MNVIYKIRKILFYPIAFLIVMNVLIRSIFKHYKLLKGYHPNMDQEALSKRVGENVLRDLENFKRNGYVR